MNVSRTGLVLAALAVLVLLAPGCRRRDRELLDNETLLQRAKDLIERRHFTEAVRVLGDMGLAEPVSPEMDPEWKLTLADAYYYQPGSVNAIEAQSRYEQFLSFHGDHPKARYARYMLGAALLRQADDPENDQEFSLKALAHFAAMANDLPDDDRWDRAAKIMMARAQDRLAEHEWLVANFYLGKKRYPGAIGRLNVVLDQYPGSRRRGEAFLTLARAQQEAGNPEQAQAALARLLEEFPRGPLAEQAREMQRNIEAAVAAPAGGKGATDATGGTGAGDTTGGTATGSGGNGAAEEEGGGTGAGGSGTAGTDGTGASGTGGSGTAGTGGDGASGSGAIGGGGAGTARTAETDGTGPGGTRGSDGTRRRAPAAGSLARR